MKVTIYLVLQSRETIQDSLKRGVDKYPMRRKLLVLGRVNFLCFIRSLLVVSSLWTNLVFYSSKHSLCPPTFFIRKRACLIVFPNHSWIPPTLPQISKGLVTRLLYHPVIANSSQMMQRHLLYEFSLVVCPTSRACCIQANKLLLKENVVKCKMSYSIIYSFTY